MVRGKPIAKTTDELMALADDFYKVMDAGKKTTIKPSGYAEGAMKIEKIASGSVDTAKQQARERGEDVVYNFYHEKLAPLKKKALTLDDLDQIDTWFQEAINDVQPNKVLGRSGNKQAQGQLTKMRKIFLDTVKNAPESAYTGGKDGVIAWKTADKIRAAAAASKDLDAVIARTIGKDQPAKTIQTGLATILDNPRYSSVFNAKEKQLMQEAIRTGIVGEGLRILGSRLAPFGGMAAGGVDAGLGILAVGGISREAAEKLRVRGVDKVREAITSRALGTPMPTMPTVGKATGGAVGVISAPLPARAISQERGVDTGEAVDVTGQPSPFDNYSNEELMQIIGQEPQNDSATPVPEVIPDTVAPPVSGNDTDFTKQNEGLRLATYQDTAGNPTVGYGFNFNSGIAPKVWKQSGLAKTKRMSDVRSGREQLTPQEADALFRTSYNIAKDDAMRFYPEFNKLSPAQQQGLVDLSYPMGLPSLKRRMPLLRKALRSQDKNGIVNAFRTDGYAKEFPERAKQIANLLITE
jgi:GH24 family phage-related lysozyme (muramidase)